MYNQTLLILSKRARIILLCGVVLAIVSGLVTLLFRMEYRADAQVLVVIKNQYGVDPYTTVRSAEMIADNLVQIMSTSDFYNKVMNQPNYHIDKSYFENTTELSRRQRWQDTLKPSVVYGTGVLNLSAYSTSQDQAKEIAGAAASALISQGGEYVGGDVLMKVVNEPVSTRFPVRPNLILNIIIGFVVGVIIMTFSMVRKYRNLV